MTLKSIDNLLTVLRVLTANPHLLAVNPSINRFMIRYMRLFRPRKIGSNLILHSHLPPLNSRAYARMVNDQFLRKIDGPSHAQIAITNACPQKCAYCYNKNRKGELLDTETILSAIGDLEQMGVVWLGITGGEPLLNRDLEKIISRASANFAVKLFTTGTGLTFNRARSLRDSGLFSVSVSLDHWDGKIHDKSRGISGAFDTALRAIELFNSVDGLDVGVSAVLSREMIAQNQVERFIDFLEELGVNEAWLSETKPSVEAFWRDDLILSEDERLALMKIQDNRNARGGITVNYLGHFEGREYFGCNAGRKMIYIDPFGEVSPCVFIPMSLGNIRTRPLEQIIAAMRSYFLTEDRCFMNKNYRLFQDFDQSDLPLSPEKSMILLNSVTFDQLSKFNKLLLGGPGS